MRTRFNIASVAWMFMVILCTVVCSAAVAHTAQEAAVEPPKDPQSAENKHLEVLRAIIASIRSNDEQLGAIEIRSDLTILNVGVTSPQTITMREADGALSTATVQPTFTFSATAVLAPDAIRYEYLDPSGAPTRILTRTVDKWIDFFSGSRSATIRRTDQLPGMPPVDPRELATFDIRRPLLSLLDTDLVRSIQFIQRDGKRVCRVEAATSAGDGSGYVVIELDPNASMLPVRSELFQPGGQRIQSTALDYQRVDSRAAWLLSTAVRNSFIVIKSIRQNARTNVVGRTKYQRRATQANCYNEDTVAASNRS